MLQHYDTLLFQCSCVLLPSGLPQCCEVAEANSLAKIEGLQASRVQVQAVEVAAFVEGLDPNHLLSSGTEGFCNGPGPNNYAKPVI